MAKVIMTNYGIVINAAYLTLVERFLKSENQGTRRRLEKRIRAFKSKVIETTYSLVSSNNTVQHIRRPRNRP